VIGSSATRVALTKFSSDGQWIIPEFLLDTYQDKALMEAKIRNIQFNGGRTYTASAMEKSWKLYEPRARWDDKNIHKVLLVFTDGEATDAAAIPAAAAKWKKRGVKIYAIGIGDNVSSKGLEQITKDPSKVLRAKNFDEVNSILSKMIKSISNKSLFLPETTTATTTAAKTTQTATPTITTTTPTPITTTATPTTTTTTTPITTTITEKITATTTTTTATTNPTMPVCKGSMSLDLQLVVDSSGSVRKKNFVQLMEDIASNLIHQLVIGSSATRVALTKYSSDKQWIVPEFLLDTYQDKALMEAKIRNIQFWGGLTYTASAMEKSWKLYEPRARWDNKNIHKVLLVFTDGEATDAEDVQAAAAKWMKRGVKIYAVGIGGNVSRRGLDQITGDPSKVLRAKNFEEVNSTLSKMLKSICT